jgi:glycerol-3-phosphate dehydrogenase
VKRNVDALKEDKFDLLILGGGITGAGVALDAVLRGFRVALIDKGDFAAGTSSVSSKLIHGGLRYLEHGGFALVYEALHERRLLLENAPHLVRPLRFIIPFYNGSRLPAWKARAGLTLYDCLAGGSNIRRSRPLSPQQLRTEFANLRFDRLNGGAEYNDAQMDDARLCLEVVRTAILHGACVANYVEAIAFAKRSSEITGVRVVDHFGGSEWTIAARQVLNATGPWVDQVCRLAGDAVQPLLRPTKGAHVIVAGQGLNTAFLLLHPRDGRVFFVIPWLGKTLIGTTDTLCDESADSLTVTSEEVDYLLQGYNRYFTPVLSPAGVLGRFAGLRPLIHAKRGEPSTLSREYRLFTSPSGLLSVAGGKYTTYRRMAEVITDTVASRLRRKVRCRTRHYRLDGAPDQPWPTFVASEVASLQNRYPLPGEAARHLVNRYGRRAEKVASYLCQHPELAEPIASGEPDLKVEFLYQREQEMAMYPADFLLRRTRLGLFCPELLKGVTILG